MMSSEDSKSSGSRRVTVETRSSTLTLDEVDALIHETNPINNTNWYLRDLITNKEWADVESLLYHISKSSSHRSDIIDNLILHHACKYNAPLRTIRRLGQRLLYSSLYTRDDDGRYPIHIAVANGCVPDVISWLIKNNTTSVGVQDRYGRTPLHYLGDYAQKLAERYPHNLDETNHITLCVAKLLVKISPESVNVEDEDETNPIEYCIFHDVDIKVIRSMQKASHRAWTKKEKSEANMPRVEKCHKDLNKKKNVQLAKPPSRLASSAVYEIKRNTVPKHVAARTA